MQYFIKYLCYLNFRKFLCSPLKYDTPVTWQTSPKISVVIALIMWELLNLKTYCIEKTLKLIWNLLKTFIKTI